MGAGHLGGDATLVETQLEALERPAHHRSADPLAGERKQALRILIQVGIVGLSHEPLQ
jgi:hypothetical protein